MKRSLCVLAAGVFLGSIVTLVSGFLVQQGLYSATAQGEGPAGPAGNGDVNGDGKVGEWPEDTLTWQDALKHCEALSFAGHDDRRLTNVRELQGIVDYGRFDTAVDPVFGAEPADYWSSTHLAPDSVEAWFP